MNSHSFKNRMLRKGALQAAITQLSELRTKKVKCAPPYSSTNHRRGYRIYPYRAPITEGDIDYESLSKLIISGRLLQFIHV
eukprot:998987-Prorocentrum_minimum.AAC.1